MPTRRRSTLGQPCKWPRWVRIARPSRCAASARLADWFAECGVKTVVMESTGVFKSLRLRVRSGLRVLRSRPLQRPADRPKRLPASLHRYLLQAELLGQIRRHLAARPHAAIGGRVCQANPQLVEHGRRQDRGRPPVPPPQISQSIRSFGIVALQQLVHPTLAQGHRGRHLRGCVALREKPDRPARGGPSWHRCRPCSAPPTPTRSDDR